MLFRSEHSVNIAMRAAEEGQSPRAFVDAKVALFREAEDALAISPDRFIRTTDPDHVRSAQEMVRRAFANGDIYVSDGEGANSNRRVAVLDKTGKFLRQWVIDDMETVHCLTMANDGMLYVCNRLGSAIRLYDKMGALKRTIDIPWKPVTPPKDGKLKQSGGSAVAIDFSPDANQRLMFVINQNNGQIDIVERASGKNLGSFGRPGSFPGQFNQAHGIAVDSKGNVYESENRGKRVQKFRPMGS